MDALPSRHAMNPLDAPREVKTPRIFEEICAQVRLRLTSGQLKPGDKLPAERELALQFGASRTAVREALRSLEMGGIVELRKGVKGGAFIREGSPAVVTQSISDMMSLGSIPLADLTESRVVILASVIRFACERGTPADLDALDACIDQTEAFTQAGRFDERRLQLLQFYRLLALATRNEVMRILVDALTQIVLSVLASVDAVPRFDTAKAQREIVACLRRRDADQAAALMSSHLNALHEHLLAAEAAQRAGKAAKAHALAAKPASPRRRKPA
ncbi:MAG: GntR family transcriptional regulator [Burkholderiales bacterium]